MLEGTPSLRIVVLLLAVSWVAHFQLSHLLGLYEDDYSHIAPWLVSDPSDLIRTVVSNFTTWPQGRPLHFSFPKIFGFIGFNVAGLFGVYTIGAIILTLNAYLFYLLLKRLGSDEFALLGALAFCLFPADTTRPFLTHATGYQPSLTFLLIAIHEYLRGLKKLSYLTILGSLLTFEAGLAAFLVAPLLKNRWERELRNEFCFHAIILAFIALATFVVRTALGDHRVLGLADKATVIPFKILAGMVIGPVISMAQWVLAPVRTFLNLDFELIVTIVIGSIALFFALSKASIQSAMNSKVALTYNTTCFTKGFVKLIALSAPPTTLAAAGLVWIVAAYGFAFTHFPPIAQFGRLTSVHLVAGLGASLLLAWVLTLTLRVAVFYGVKYFVIALSAVYLAALLGYGVIVQRDYRSSWDNQRSFWTQVLSLTGDAADSTLIFVLKKHLPETRYILTHSWADPIILEQIFQFPTTWNQMPRLFVVEENWADSIMIEGSRLKWKMPKAHWRAHWIDLPDGNVILLRMNGNKLHRMNGTVDMRGHSLHLKPAEAGFDWKQRVLFDLLIEKSKGRAR